ncbi:MAG: hypothetical protein ACXWCB_06205 [Acidimicrobiales bacterium]
MVVAALLLGMLPPYATLSYLVARDVPDLGRGVFELTFVVTPLVALPLAAVTGCVGVGLLRSGAGRRWFAWASLVAAGLLAIGACSFQVDGFLSPDVQQQVVHGLLAVWLVASGPGSQPTSEGAQTVARGDLDGVPSGHGGAGHRTRPGGVQRST